MPIKEYKSFGSISFKKNKNTPPHINITIIIYKKTDTTNNTIKKIIKKENQNNLD
jgi:hypothetical protein